jgi:hypothetical protein
MKFFKKLFNADKPTRTAREATDDELNAILVPLGKEVADFKDRTQLSHTHILRAVNAIGIKLLVQARGVDSVRLLYRVIIDDFDAIGGLPVASHLGIEKPSAPPELIAELNVLLWKIANDMIAKGKPVEHVAQAYTALATMVAERVTGGDPWLAKYLIAEAARELRIYPRNQLQD